MTTANNDHRPAIAAPGDDPAEQTDAGTATATRVQGAFSRVSARWRPDSLDIGIAVVVLAVIVAGTLTTRFFSLDNARAILASSALVGIAAIGATVVMIAGSARLAGRGTDRDRRCHDLLATQQFGLPAAIVLALACGLTITALQGAVIGFWTANPIVLTIAAGFAIDGMAIWISGGSTVYPKVTAFNGLNDTPLRSTAGRLRSAGDHCRRPVVPAPHHAGRQMYLIGENPAAARAAGLPVARVTVIAWAFFGACIALTGVFLAAFNTSANSSLGGTLSLDVIAAVLVGGTAISGGKGSALRTLGGAVLISAISDLLLLRGLSTGIQLLVKGILVLLVVIAVHVRSARGRR